MDGHLLDTAVLNGLLRQTLSSSHGNGLPSNGFKSLCETYSMVSIQGGVAQLAEQQTFNLTVAGSIPAALTRDLIA